MILTIDTSTDVTVVGVYDPAQRQLIAAECDAEGVRHGDVLLPRIARVLGVARLSPVDVAALAVGVGPGSFTGLRIGLSTAQGWALAMGVPAYGVVSSLAIAWPWLQDAGKQDAGKQDAGKQDAGSGAGSPVVVVSDAFKGEVAVAIYSFAVPGNGDAGAPTADRITTVAAPVACSPAVAVQRIAALLDCGPAPTVVGGGLRRYDAEVTQQLPPACRILPPSKDAPACEALATLSLAQASDGDPRRLVPLYVRDADAKLPERPLKL